MVAYEKRSIAIRMEVHGSKQSGGSWSAAPDTVTEPCFIHMLVAKGLLDKWRDGPEIQKVVCDVVAAYPAAQSSHASRSERLDHHFACKTWS
jgi:hypothetical protein